MSIEIGDFIRDIEYRKKFCADYMYKKGLLSIPKDLDYLLSDKCRYPISETSLDEWYWNLFHRDLSTDENTLAVMKLTEKLNDRP